LNAAAYQQRIAADDYAGRALLHKALKCDCAKRQCTMTARAWRAQMSKKFRFEKTIAKGTPPHETGPDNKRLLVVEGPIPCWGQLVSYEMGIFRDGNRALDISTYSLGAYHKANGSWSLKFQLWDLAVSSVADAEYRVEASFHIR
jgi:hypothetical protein